MSNKFTDDPTTRTDDLIALSQALSPYFLALTAAALFGFSVLADRETANTLGDGGMLALGGASGLMGTGGRREH